MLFLLMTTGGPPRDSADLYERLIAEMAAGDTAALEQLYARTKSAVYGFALSILKNPQNAEDVMQDTYVRLFQAAAGYRAQGKPMAWILTIVRNFCLMKLRDQRADTPLDEEAWQRQADPDSFTESSADRMVLDAALRILSDEERQIVILHSVTGLKHREIAALLELPLSTVLSKYRRALSKLQKIMVKEEAL